MIVLGLDPGVTRHGWALLNMPKAGRGRMLAGGHVLTEKVPERFQSIGEWYECTMGHVPWIELVGIETPDGYVHEHKRGAALLATAVEAGRFIERAGNKGMALSAAQVRKSLVRDPSASDEAVEAALRVFLDMPKRSNVHARDAAAVALVAWQRWLVDHGREMRAGLLWVGNSTPRGRAVQAAPRRGNTTTITAAWDSPAKSRGSGKVSAHPANIM